jgi:hypothetical protein
MKLNEAPDAKLIAAYIKVRDDRAKRKAEYETADADDKGKQEKIEAEFLRRFHERGTDATSADGLGTAFVEVVAAASVANKDVYFDWLIESPRERMCFVEARANKTAIRQYRDEHDDIPPGINWRETQVVRFRRA